MSNFEGEDLKTWLLREVDPARPSLLLKELNKHGIYRVIHLNDIDPDDPEHINLIPPDVMPFFERIRFQKALRYMRRHPLFRARYIISS